MDNNIMLAEEGFMDGGEAYTPEELDIINSEKVTSADLIALLPAHTSLCDVDYRDSLENSWTELQSAIHTQCLDGLYEQVDEWFVESSDYAMDYYLKELQSDIAMSLNVSSSKAQELIETFRDEITDAIYSRDTSNPLHDLLRNTNIVAFYDTGLEVSEETWSMDKDTFVYWRNRIMRKFHLKGKKNSEAITELLINASYGGQLVIYFKVDEFETLCNAVENKCNRIQFKRLHLALIDTYNGSGHDVYLPDCEIALPFTPTRLFVDKAIKYNYTYQVCGLGDNWCDDTDYTLLQQGRKVHTKQSTIQALHEQDNHFAAVYASGKCSFDDNDIKRHRDLFYNNNFPCGTHCPHCNRFWID